MISTAIIHHSKYIIYHDSKIEAKAPTKKVNLRKSGTLPRYSIISYIQLLQKDQQQHQHQHQKQNKSTNHSYYEQYTRY